MVNFLRQFLKYEAASGIFLIFSAAVAMALTNSSLAPLYHHVFDSPLSFPWGAIPLNHSLLFWINDGLMAIFFFLIGLEIKREVVEGHLSERAKRVLPGIATLGGVLFPALIYLAFNHDDSLAVRGWAIPAATDIAFALGILALAGNKVPQSLKVFLMTIAVLDDLMAVLIIAFFYTHTLSLVFIGSAALVLILLGMLNAFKVRSIPIYILLSLLLWVFILQSGVHATVAGILAAWMIPCGCDSENNTSPLVRIEAFLNPWVAYLILPLFAFANAGISFQEISLPMLFSALPLGIMGGLVLGKPLGVFLGTWLTVKFGWGRLPVNATWCSVLGVSILCGIGFTMSIFIASLAFESQALYGDLPRVSVLLASGVSALIGYLVLRYAIRRPRLA